MRCVILSIYGQNNPSPVEVVLDTVCHKLALSSDHLWDIAVFSSNQL